MFIFCTVNQGLVAWQEVNTSKTNHILNRIGIDDKEHLRNILPRTNSSHLKMG